MTEVINPLMTNGKRGEKMQDAVQEKRLEALVEAYQKLPEWEQGRMYGKLENLQLEALGRAKEPDEQ